MKQSCCSNCRDSKDRSKKSCVCGGHSTRDRKKNLSHNGTKRKVDYRTSKQLKQNDE